MRRLVLLVVVAGIAAGAGAAVVQASSSSPSPGGGYTVDAIFDQTSGLIPQNNVMIAGAKVGTVTAVKLTRGYRARVQMQIAGRYGPFHGDARCQIRPVALIGEMEVNCDPGTAARGVLRASGGQPPTVPVAMTTVPVDLTDLFDIWSTPVTQRISEIMWTLGAGLAGRGGDLNSVLQRSNPTLTLARQTIDTLNGQRAQLGSLIDSSDRLLGRLAPNTASLRRFLGQAATLTAITGAHRGPLAQSVQRLPGLLSATRPALAQLDAVAANATPVLQNLHAAAPNLNRAIGQLVPLGAVALPAIRRLGTVAATGLRVLPALEPLSGQLRDFAHMSLPVAQLLSLLFINLRQRGFVESLNDFPYYVGSSLSRFDQVSHLNASNFLGSGCGGSNQTQYAQCSAMYHPAQAAAAAATAASRSGQGGAPAASTLKSLIGYLLK